MLPARIASSFQRSLTLRRLPLNSSPSPSPSAPLPSAPLCQPGPKWARFIPILLILSALHGVTATLTYCLYTYIYPTTLSNALALCAIVVVPYGLLLLACKLVRGKAGLWIACIATILTASGGNTVYFSAFEVSAQSDTFAAGLFLVAVLQSMLAALALGLIYWRRRVLTEREILKQPSKPLKP